MPATLHEIPCGDNKYVDNKELLLRLLFYCHSSLRQKPENVEVVRKYSGVAIDLIFSDSESRCLVRTIVRSIVIPKSKQANHSTCVIPPFLYSFVFSSRKKFNHFCSSINNYAFDCCLLLLLTNQCHDFVQVSCVSRHDIVPLIDNIVASIHHKCTCQFSNSTNHLFFGGCFRRHG